MVHASAARATTVVRAKAAAACCATARVDYHIDTYFEDTGHDVQLYCTTSKTAADPADPADPVHCPFSFCNLPTPPSIFEV